MIIEKITQADISERALFYSRWHSVSTTEKGPHYDINVGGLVGPILSMGNDTFVVCIYLTELLQLSEDYTLNETGFKIWEISAGTMILEDTNGIRYFGTIEALRDLGEEGLQVQGTSCLFTDNLDDAYIESFFMIRNLLPKPTDAVPVGKDFKDVEDFVRAVEPIMREILPEKFI